MSRQTEIETLLRNAFSPGYLQVLNESHRHSVPENSETHFKLTVASQAFSGLSKIQRHQKVYGLLGPMMQQGLHALALHTYTEEEWRQTQANIPASPDCMGASKGA